MDGSASIDPSELSLTDLRARRAELQRADDAVSYVRRLAQARLDMVSHERQRRLSGSHLNVAEDLPAVFSRHLTGGPARPPRPVEDASEHPLAIQLDELCSEVRADHMAELGDDELELVASRLEAFERARSNERRDLFNRLDALSAELVRRYRDGEATVDGLYVND